MAVVGALLPHALHLGAAGLEVPEVLLAQAWLLVHLDAVPLEGGGVGVLGGQGLEDALGGLPRPAVGRREELDRVLGLEQGSQSTAGIARLGPAVLGQLHPVVGDRLVYLSVLCVGLYMVMSAWGFFKATSTRHYS